MDKDTDLREGMEFFVPWNDKNVADAHCLAPLATSLFPYALPYNTTERISSDRWRQKSDDHIIWIKLDDPLTHIRDTIS